MTDRLLHYHAPPDSKPRAGQSVHGAIACVSALGAIGLMFAMDNRSLPDAMYPLCVPGIIAMSGAATLGCVLAALDPSAKRTFVWIGMCLTASIPLCGVELRYSLFRVLLPF